jgi:hypothetical protein
LVDLLHGILAEFHFQHVKAVAFRKNDFSYFILICGSKKVAGTGISTSTSG